MGNKGLKKVSLWNPDGPSVRAPNREAPEEFRRRGFWCEDSKGPLRPAESVEDTQLWGCQLAPLSAKQEQPPQPPAAVSPLRVLALPPGCFPVYPWVLGALTPWTPPNPSDSLCHHRIHPAPETYPAPQQLNPHIPIRSAFIYSKMRMNMMQTRN